MVSLYLDVDGRRYPRQSDYTPHLEHLFRVAREVAAAHGIPPASLEQDLGRIAGWVDQGLDRSSTRGIAAFSASDQGLFEAFALRVPVRDQVVVARNPDVAQLIAALAGAVPALVVAVDHQRARMLRIGWDGTEEVGAPTDDVERQVDTDVELGSFEHRHEEHVRQHLRRVARAVTDELALHPAGHVVLSGSTEVVSQLESSFPKHVAALVAGRMVLPTVSRPAELEAAARDVVEQARRQQQRDVVAQVRERAEQAAGAVVGLAATLEAVSDGEAETVVVDPSLAAPGGRCGDCGALWADIGQCPRCGGGVVPVDNVVDAAVVAAFLDHVNLEFYGETDLGLPGRIGALTRHRPRPTPSAAAPTTTM